MMQRDFPLHRCCRDGDAEDLQRILDSGCLDLYAEDTFYGWTPAHWAAYFGRFECLKKVITHHAMTTPQFQGLANRSVDIQTKKFCQTPLHVAAFAGNLQCLKWLLHCGAGLDKQDHLGETPLHKAVRTGSMDAVKMLTSHAASCGIRNNNGQLPKDLARACGYIHLAEYIQQIEQFTTIKHPYEPMDESMDSETKGCTKPAADVLVNNAVAANVIPIGGRKRQHRDDEPQNPFKRARINGAGGDFGPALRALFDESAHCKTADVVMNGNPINGNYESDCFQALPLLEGSPLFFESDEGFKGRRYPGSLEFGHAGEAVAHLTPSPTETSPYMAHRFLSSSNHYNINGLVAASGMMEHCNSVLQEQDYCANYSQLMDDEMFKNIHGC